MGKVDATSLTTSVSQISIIEDKTVKNISTWITIK